MASMRILVATVVLLPMAAFAQSSPPAPGALVGKAAVKALVGNTVEFSLDGGDTVVLYMRPDGTGRGYKSQGTERDKPDPLSWATLPDGRLCVDDEGKNPNEDECVAVSVSGNKVTFTMPGRPEILGTIQKGNPRGL